MSKHNDLMADVFASLVSRMQKISESQDIVLATVEFALGLPIVQRSIDLAFGYCEIESGADSNNKRAEIVIGSGLLRLEGVLNTTPSTRVGLNVTDLLNALDTVQDVYVVGSVFITADGTIDWTLVNGASGADSTPPLPICIVRDNISESEILSIADSQTAILPEGSLVILNFVLSIDQYIKNANPLQAIREMKLIRSDKRRPRGWGGYADEIMSTLTVASCEWENTLYSDIFEVNETIRTLVSQWIAINDWQPSFSGYWHHITKPLPPILYEYIKNNLNIDAYIDDV